MTSVLIQNGELYSDGNQIIYVNGAYKVKEGEEKTELMSLIEDFRCSNANDMTSQILATRMKQIKNSEEEMTNMCKEVEKYAANKVAEAKMGEKIENVIGMIKEGLGIDLIARVSRLTVDQVTAIGKQASLL